MVGFQRFIPSEFGLDPDRAHAVEPAAELFRVKASIRRAIEAERIPYTYLVSNGFAGYFLNNFGHADATVPARDKVVLNGDGNSKSISIKFNHLLPSTCRDLISSFVCVCLLLYMIVN